MTYIARFKGRGTHYRVLLPFQAIGTINEATYRAHKGKGTTQANQYVKTLVVNSYTDYQFIRQEYKELA